MLRKLLAVALSLMLAAASGMALAKPGGHGGSAGGKSATHMSEQGTANTNGPTAADRDKGQDRAADRQSDKSQGHHQTHQKSTHTKHMGGGKKP
jgi:hypothetical protein